LTDIPAALERLQSLIDAALRLGADAADAAWSTNLSESVSVRLGALEDVTRSESEEIVLRVFIGRKVATVSGSDLRALALAELPSHAMAMAREALEDPYAGLAERELLMLGPIPDLGLDDHAEPGADALRARAIAAEDAARAVMGVTNSEGAGAGVSRTGYALVTSGGFARGYTLSGHSVSASVVAGEGAGMQRDYAYHSVRRLADLEGAEAVGARAGTRAVARLNSVKIPSGAMPVLFDPRVSGGLVSHLLGAMSGPAVARGTSFLAGKLEEQVIAEGVRILEDPLRPAGMRSKPFDGEGVATRARALAEGGRVAGWLCDSPSARQLGLQPTGHAVRGGGVSAGNVHVEAGRITREAMIAGVKRGFLVTELIGQGVNPVTGDYSRGAAGFLIENGEVGHAVAEVTIAGNLLDMFRNMTPAADLEFRRGIDAPTLLIEGMTVAGS